MGERFAEERCREGANGECDASGAGTVGLVGMRSVGVGTKDGTFGGIVDGRRGREGLEIL